MVDKVMFVKTLAHIELEHEAWLQPSWGSVTTPIDMLGVEIGDIGDLVPDEVIKGCGTAFCLAGTASMLAGNKPVWRWTDTWDADKHKYVPAIEASHVLTPDGRELPVRVAGGLALGLLDSEDDDHFPWVFMGSLNLSDLYRHAAALLGMTEQELHIEVLAEVDRLLTAEAVNA